MRVAPACVTITNEFVALINTGIFETESIAYFYCFRASHIQTNQCWRKDMMRDQFSCKLSQMYIPVPLALTIHISADADDKREISDFRDIV